MAEGSSVAGPIQYVPGRGLQVDRWGITAGGYATIALERKEGAAAKLNFDDLNFLISANPSPRLHLFSELELDDLVSVDGNGHGGTRDFGFNVARLYGDVALSNRLNVRAGTFLTPVGRWNVINAQPLLWTTSQPLTTEKTTFDPTTTGLMLFGALLPHSDSLTYSVFGQCLQPIEHDPEFNPADYSVGARLEQSLDDDLSVGGTYLASRHTGMWSYLGGLDLLWHRGPLELMAEAVIEEGKASFRQWGGYVQGAYRLSAPFYMVGRFEHFDQPPPDPEVNLIALGFAYKPYPFLVLKAEYLVADRSGSRERPGMRSSVAALF